jgi:lipoprotein-anchoring transpeptidase ErfK/SrfK
MVLRRAVLFGLVATFLVPASAWAHKSGTQFVLDPQYEPQLVEFGEPFEPGTVVVDPAARFLYLIEAPGVARRYGIGVGKSGLAFKGTASVGQKAKWPAWRPTDNMIRRNPRKYAKYANGLRGGPGNPLGSRALYLYRDGRDTLYRIHGTTEPWSIGKAVSNGCIRMLNEHVEDLYERVPVGATVVVR